MSKQEMPAAVKRAIRHVQTFHPSATTVLISTARKWLYVDDDNVAPAPWNRQIDVSMLEAAADSVPAEDLPAVFRLGPQVIVESVEEFVEKVFPSAADEAGEIFSTQAARRHLREELYKLKT